MLPFWEKENKFVKAILMYRQLGKYKHFTKGLMPLIPLLDCPQKSRKRQGMPGRRDSQEKPCKLGLCVILLGRTDPHAGGKEQATSGPA